MKKKCAICGRIFETDNKDQDICYDCEIVEELVDYEDGEIDGESL